MRRGGFSAHSFLLTCLLTDMSFAEKSDVMFQNHLVSLLRLIGSEGYHASDGYALPESILPGAKQRQLLGGISEEANC
jgi:hypothetical protein